MRPVIYQVLPRLFGNDNPHCTPGGSAAINGCGKLADFDEEALQEIRSLGATHVWYTGLPDHATLTDHSLCHRPADSPTSVKGQAGSPYAVRDWYNIAPDLAVHPRQRLREFDALVRRTHACGLGFIMDFVPNHTAARYVGEKQPFTDENYYPGHIHDGDWSDTAKLNYESRDTWNKMRDILLFWAARGVDGFRCDMAELVPVAFWQWVVPQVKKEYPSLLFIGEVYQPWRYEEFIKQGGFDYLYDKVGLYDTLVAILRGWQPASDITRCWQTLGNAGPHMLHFLENHDEVRLASDFICRNGLYALPAMIVTACMDACPLLVYFGQELGERGMEAEGFSGIDGKTSIFDYCSVPAIREWRRWKKEEQTEPSATAKVDRKGKALPCSGSPKEETATQAELSVLDNNKDFKRQRTEDGRQRTEEGERLALRSFYARLLTLCNESPALREGRFFDLMYVNPYSPDFDPRYHYAFLRQAEGELLLIVVNFAPTPAALRVTIPQHAFDYLSLPTLARSQATELLTGSTLGIVLQPGMPVSVSLRGHSGAILRIPLKE